MANVGKINQHNSGVMQAAFFRQDVVGDALLLVLKDVTASMALLAKQLDVELPLKLKDDGSLDQDEYFRQGHANVQEQYKQQEEAKVRGNAPAQEPLIAKSDDNGVAVFGGDYENSGTTNTEERQAAP